MQAALIPHLEVDGWTITSAVDTSTKERGKDVVGTDDARTLWVSVKGYPLGTARTNAAAQARHWFSHGLFDMVLWHGEDRTRTLMLALPGFPTYRNLAERSEWLVHATPFTIAWLDELGGVRWHPPAPEDRAFPRQVIRRAARLVLLDRSLAPGPGPPRSGKPPREDVRSRCASRPVEGSVG